MHGVLLLPIAGLLFLVLAGVEWALYRLEQNEVHHSRLRAFGASSLGLLLLWGGIAYWTGREAAGRWATPTTAEKMILPETGAPVGALATLVEPAKPALDLVVALLNRADPPSLRQARADRDELLKARRTLAVQPLGNDAEEYVLQEIDTLLGAAYSALGEQWRFVRAGEWTTQTQATALTTLHSEWNKWVKLQSCLARTPNGCLPEPDHSERSAALHAWQRALRLYLLDCIRFDEEDPDLAWLPPAELRAARDRLALGRTELVSQALPAWGDAITAAADNLFVTANHALQIEETVSAQGHWDRQTMARAYQPVKAAWDLLFERTFCALGDGLPCSGRRQ